MFSSRCGWCREDLVRVRGPWLLRVLGCGLFRLYRCPHCQDHFVRFYWFQPSAKSADERPEQRSHANPPHPDSSGD